MDIRNIGTFIKVAELGSFTKTAAELGYVQSAITMQVKQLEKELGYPLFDRIGKRVSLTALGEQFLTYAYDIVRVMHEATHPDKSAKEMHGTLRVGVLESLLFSNLLPLLPSFRAAYPHMKLQLKMGQTTELLEQLKQNRLDMVYLSAECRADPDLRCDYERREELVFLCGGGHPLAHKRKVSVTELLRYDFIATEHTGICFGKLRALADRHNVPLVTAIEVDSTIAIASLLRQNEGFAFLPAYAVRGQLERGELVTIDVDCEPQVYHSRILCHQSRWASPFMEGLIAHIREAYPEST